MATARLQMERDAQIAADRRAGMTVAALAERYGVSETTVKAAVRRARELHPVRLAAMDLAERRLAEYDEVVGELRGLARAIPVAQASAKAVGVSPSHLSRVIRGADGKRPSLDLLQRLAQALGVPTDYFIETRTAVVIAVLKTDAGLTDNLYGKLGLAPDATSRADAAQAAKRNTAAASSADPPRTN